MDKFVRSNLKEQAIKNGTWLSGLNGMLPILLVLFISLFLGGYAVVNYCYSGCNIF